jgi:polysaccharide biosynthesis/export protein
MVTRARRLRRILGGSGCLGVCACLVLGVSVAAGGPQGPKTAPAATASPSSAALVRDDYQLSPGDKLRVEVYREAQLSQSLQVRPDGKVTMPLIGELMAAGRTPIELRNQITESLKEYVTNPVVTVMVVEATPATVFVMGEVLKPGPLALQSALTPLQALAMAGGFKDFAKTKDIRVLRRGPSGMTTLKFNYDEAVKGRGPTIYLQPGDTVIVP